MVPGEARSWRRYWLTFAVVAAAFLWWLGPVMGLFLVDPMIQLMVNSIQASWATQLNSCSVDALSRVADGTQSHREQGGGGCRRAQQGASEKVALEAELGHTALSCIALINALPE